MKEQELIGAERFGRPFVLAEPPLREKVRPPRHKKGERFLKGPIPELWIRRAAGLPGRALAVAIALWMFAGMKNTREIRLSLKWLEKEWGINRHASARALKALEEAGLVSVIRHKGRKPRVTILDSPAAQHQGDAQWPATGGNGAVN